MLLTDSSCGLLSTISQTPQEQCPHWKRWAWRWGNGEERETSRRGAGRHKIIRAGKRLAHLMSRKDGYLCKAAQNRNICSLLVFNPPVAGAPSGSLAIQQTIQASASLIPGRFAAQIVMHTRA